MAGRAREGVPAAVRRLGARLKAYRRKPDRSKRLPCVVWKRAVELARKHGVSCVANALQMNYGDLKRRVQSSGEQGRGGSDSAKKFVEIKPGIPLWSTDCTVEMEDGSGRKMMVRSGQPGEAELVDLAKVFWGRQG